MLNRSEYAKAAGRGDRLRARLAALLDVSRSVLRAAAPAVDLLVRLSLAKAFFATGMLPGSNAADFHTTWPMIIALVMGPALLAAGFLHSKDRHVAVASPGLPRASWRLLARKFGRKIVHLPLKRFSGQLLERLRTFHVLNGKHVRSYAADYIRDL